MARFVLLALALSACAATPEPGPTAPRVITQEVRVPVLVVREAPREVQRCGTELPHVQVLPAQAPDAFIALTEDEAEDLRQVLDRLDRCLSAWRVWEMRRRVED